MEELFNLTNYHFSWYGTLVTLGLCSWIIFGIYSLILGRKLINIAFSLVLLPAIVLWLLSYIITFITHSDYVAQFASNYINVVGLSFIPIAFIFYCAVLTKQLKKAKIPIIIIAVAMVILVTAHYSSDFFITYAKKYYYGYNLVVGGPLGYFWAVFVSAGAVYGLYLLIKQYRVEKIYHRKSAIKLASIAFLLGWLSSIDWLVAFEIINYPRFNNAPFFLIGGFLFFYATVRYEMLQNLPKVATKIMIESMADVVLAIDNKEKIIFANDAALRTLKYSKTKLLGKNMNIVFGITTIFDRTILKGSIKNERTALTNAQGTKLYLSITASPFKSGTISKKTKGIIIVAKNTTPLEDALRKARSATARLTQAQKRLLTHTEELEQFNQLAIEREEQMVQLKKKIKELEGSKIKKI